MFVLYECHRTKGELVCPAVAADAGCAGTDSARAPAVGVVRRGASSAASAMCRDASAGCAAESRPRHGVRPDHSGGVGCRGLTRPP